MSVTYYFEEKIPKYICLSTDVSGSKVAGISVIGAKVLFTDTGTEWIVGDDLKLVHYATNVITGVSGSSTSTSGSSTFITNFPTTFSGSLTNTSIATTDSGPSWVSSHGIGGSPVVLASGSVLTNVTDAPTSGQKLVITDLIISTSTAMQVTFKCETTNAPIIGPLDLSASVPLQLTTRSKAWKLATADKHLQILTSVSGSIMIDPHYFSEA